MNINDFKMNNLKDLREKKHLTQTKLSTEIEYLKNSSLITKMPNGYGSIVKLSGKRRKPYQVRLTKGFTNEGKQIYMYLGYFEKKEDASPDITDSIYTHKSIQELIDNIDLL